MAKDYTSTLNLPRTSFEMRANLPKREPQMIEYWNSIDLYSKLSANTEGKPLFVLHDGPPFSNGNIHMGTAMNKILKDFIIKSKGMLGFSCPYIPGWDNHGMPIESAIIKKNKIDRKKMSIPEFRDACHKFAENFVDIQRNQFIRLGVSGDWNHPYLTMNPSFEAREVKVFGEMFRKGYIYKGLKPVYWCPNDETALAEAEIEYADDKCTSIYVKFLVKDDKGLLANVCDLSKTYFVIWTTTTWTLPGNVAIAVNPSEDYAVTLADGNYYITAAPLAAKTMIMAGIENYETVATFKGRDLEYMTAYHPFLDRESLVVNADYVTMDSGTGCVHTAPGFGADDYVTGRRYRLPIVVPVDDKGYQTEEAGKFAGLYYEKSNEVILADLKESGALLASEEFTHSYPHCWRCKKPIIFRATPQWFCSVEAFKDEAVKACENVEWLPAWGGERIVQMVKERADWCISRQRHWGLPIPVFECADCKKVVCTDETINKVSERFGEYGSNVWYNMTPEELLGDACVCPHCGGKHLIAETDTLDGWFDSGSSHFATLENKEGLKWPADLYLEGADQYRGWFQSSLLTAVAAKGEGAPYKTVLTHGWVVDGEGKAMHKSLGNSVAPEEMITKYGADIVRLWVASSDYRVDVRVSDNIFKQLSETYRKIRNTARIILANLNGFDPNKDMVDEKDMFGIDKWALGRLAELVDTCKEGYNSYEFHVVYHAINNFCTVDMSKLYIDIIKDRVYVEKADSLARRSAQTAMYKIISALTRVAAPLIAFTAEEIWQAMPHLESDKTESVFLNDMPSSDEFRSAGETEAWDKLFELRDGVMKALELARAEKLIGKSLEAKVTIYSEDENTLATLNALKDQLAMVFIVSKAEVVCGQNPNAHTEEGDTLSVLVEAAQGRKCDRCWTVSEEGSETEDGGFICERCKKILGL